MPEKYVCDIMMEISCASSVCEYIQYVAEECFSCTEAIFHRIYYKRND